MTTRRVILTLLVGAVSGCGIIPIRENEPPAPTTVFNGPLDALWTTSTLDAASTPQQLRQLKRARPVTLTGEVIDVSCFLQLGKRGEAHIPCGQKCVRRGQPIGLLTDAGRLYVLFAEEWQPRRDGKDRLMEHFAELIGKRVKISGMATQYQHYRALFVRTLPITEH